MVSYRDLSATFKELNIPHSAPVIVHASLSRIGEIRGGAETVLGALLANYSAC
jgi:aminoglycoside 3-N-acetyltransferase